jgi:hypothetical protein
MINNNKCNFKHEALYICVAMLASSCWRVSNKDTKLVCVGIKVTDNLSYWFGGNSPIIKTGLKV